MHWKVNNVPPDASFRKASAMPSCWLDSTSISWKRVTGRYRWVTEETQMPGTVNVWRYTRNLLVTRKHQLVDLPHGQAPLQCMVSNTL